MNGVKSGALARIASLCLLLGLGACAGITPGVAPKLDGVKRVGIVSAMGDTFSLQKVGATVFGNSQNEFPVGSWGIDELMASKVRAAVGRRFDIRPVTYQRSAFYASNSSGIGAMVRAAAPSGGVDAYLVITRGISKVGASNQFVSGLGLVDVSGGVLFSNSYYIHAIYAIYLIDANTFSSMGVAISLMPGESVVDPMRTTVLRGPHRQVDQSWWPSTDAASNPRLKAAVVDLIDASLANTLRQLELSN